MPLGSALLAEAAMRFLSKWASSIGREGMSISRAIPVLAFHVEESLTYELQRDRARAYGLPPHH